MDHALQDIAQHTDAYIKADLDFHSTLARATGNRLFLIVSSPVHGLVQDLMDLSRRTPGAPERGQHFHRLLLESIKVGDPDKAREVMRAHIGQACSDARQRSAKEGESKVGLWSSVSCSKAPSGFCLWREVAGS